MTLRVLGGLECDGPGADALAPVLLQPKRAALLVYLVLEGRGDFMSRDAVMALFWPEADQARARSALRQSLAFIRAHAGADAVENRGRHAVRASPRMGCDVLSFSALLETGRHEEALACYRGAFLDGLHVVGARPLTDWVEARRSALRARASEAAWTLADRYLEEARPDRAAFWGKRALDLSAQGEVEARRLMLLLERAGDRAGALRVYRGLEARLEREYRCAPAPETRALAERVRSKPARGPELPLAAGRRGGHDRRAREERRVSDAPMQGPERRRGERRRSERRTGTDRRRDAAD